MLFSKINNLFVQIVWNIRPLNYINKITFIFLLRFVHWFVQIIVTTVYNVTVTILRSWRSPRHISDIFLAIFSSLSSQFVVHLYDACKTCQICNIRFWIMKVVCQEESISISLSSFLPNWAAFYPAGCNFTSLGSFYPTKKSCHLFNLHDFKLELHFMQKWTFGILVMKNINVMCTELPITCACLK